MQIWPTNMHTTTNCIQAKEPEQFKLWKKSILELVKYHLHARWWYFWVNGTTHRWCLMLVKAPVPMVCYENPLKPVAFRSASSSLTFTLRSVWRILCRLWASIDAEIELKRLPDNQQKIYLQKKCRIFFCRVSGFVVIPFVESWIFRHLGLWEMLRGIFLYFLAFYKLNNGWMKIIMKIMASCSVNVTWCNWFVLFRQKQYVRQRRVVMMPQACRWSREVRNDRKCALVGHCLQS